MRDESAHALATRAYNPMLAGDGEDALAALDELLKRFGKTPDAKAQEQVAWGLRATGTQLERMGKRYEALAAYEALLAHFDSGESDAIDETVKFARERRGYLVTGRRW